MHIFSALVCSSLVLLIKPFIWLLLLKKNKFNDSISQGKNIMLLQRVMFDFKLKILAKNILTSYDCKMHHPQISYHINVIHSFSNESKGRIPEVIP